MNETNIFLNPFKTTGGLVPFDRITTADYEPAIREGIKRHDAQVTAIVENQDEPTFDNTIVALERAGETLNRVLGVFYPMLSCNADDELMAVSERMAPVLSEHFNSITLNERLWQRVKHVHDRFDAGCHDVGTDGGAGEARHEGGRPHDRPPRIDNAAVGGWPVRAEGAFVHNQGSNKRNRRRRRRTALQDFALVAGAAVRRTSARKRLRSDAPHPDGGGETASALLKRPYRGDYGNLRLG